MEQPPQQQKDEKRKKMIVSLALIIGLLIVLSAAGYVIISSTPPAGRVLANVSITPGSASLRVGDSRAFTATAYDQGGSEIAEAAFSWAIAANLGTLSPSSGKTTTFVAESVGSETLRVSASFGGSVKESTATITISEALYAASFEAQAPSSVDSYSPFQLTLTVKDQEGGTFANYVGAVYFSSNDSLASLPADYTYVPADAGVHVFSVVLKTPGLRWIVITDVSDSSLTTQVAIQVNNRPPVAAFTLAVNGDTISVDASGSSDTDGSIVAYQWNFGDGNTTTGITASYTYGMAGTYIITLTVRDDLNSTGSTSRSADVNVNPVADFFISPSSPSAGKTVTFNASASSDSDGSVTSYTWDFGDGNTGNGVVVTHTYATPGNYSVTLSVTDNSGASDSITRFIFVSPLQRPVADLQWTPATVYANDTVSFDASSSYDPDGVIVSYAWDFGDSTTGTGVTTTHAYATPGDYVVRLNVTDDDSLWNTTSRSITVLLNLPPVANFTYSPASPVTNQSVSFDGSASIDPEGAIVSFDWDFGDGNTGSGSLVIHSFVGSGNYTVTLTVTDDHGQTNTASQVVSVRPAVAPVASFSWTPASPLFGDNVTFDTSASSDPDGSIVSYDWDFGDGNVGSGVIVNHTYSVWGTYNVTLVVTDNDGLTGIMVRQVKILAVPTADFTYSQRGLLVDANGTTSFDPDGSIINYTWDWGDGNVTYGVMISHTYGSAGVYTLTLTVADDDGLTNVTSQDVTVIDLIPPVASFSYSPAKPLVGENVTFDASGSVDPDYPPIASYDWDFGDGNTGSGQIVAHAYASYGNYTVVLTVTDSDGLTDTTLRVVRTYAAPVANFTFSPATPRNGTVITLDASTSADADGPIVSYNWTFGDGNTGTGVIVTHTYAVPGNYTVTLTVSDNDAFSDTTAVTVDVAENQMPTASFTFSPASPLQGENVTFDATSSSDPEGPLASYEWNFGDGNTGSGSIVTHTYSAWGVYTVTLVVRDSDGASASNSTSVRVLIGPTATFTPSTSTALVGDLIMFDGSASSDPDGSIVSYSWNFGDNSTDTGAVVTHTYTAPSVYTVTLTVTDDDGLTASFSLSITVLSPPTAAIIVETSPAIKGEPVKFNASNSFDLDGSIVLYQWNFGDGKTGTGVVITHTYSSWGDFTVTLTVKDNHNLTDTTTVLLTVYSRPVADFDWSPASPTVGQNVAFNASASYDLDGVITSYTWDFGDGTNASGMIVNHSYSTSGSYSVTLTVTDNDGVVDTLTRSLGVNTTLPPVPDFFFTPSTPLYTDSVTFNASDSYDPDGTILNYTWDFGDGTNASGMIVSHTYSTWGTYNVTLTVTDDDGLVNSTTKTIRPMVSPTANLTASGTTIVLGQSVTFNASASVDPDGTIVSYAWEFGDGTTGTGVVVSHIYATWGTFTVNLTVTDDDGLTDVATLSITVLSPPTADFGFLPAKPLEGQLISFNSGGSFDPDGTIVSYAWTFGDGDTSTSANPTHTYATFGNYTVTLTVTDNDGLSDSFSLTVRVLAVPSATFTHSPASPRNGETATFNASASSDPDGSIVSYSWNWGDGNTGSGVVATHAYAATGNYTVVLTVTDNDNLTNTSSQTVTVIQNLPPTASFTYSPLSPKNGQLITFNASASSDPEGKLLTYSWDFGDGDVASGMIVTHSYAVTGNYTATLTVTDDLGVTNSTIQTISVSYNAPPTASFTATRDLLVASVDASASSDPDGSIVSYSWNWGDGNTGSGITATHSYSIAGLYTITLTVTDDIGATASATHQVSVNSTTIDFTYYDFFVPPWGEFWDMRTFTYGDRPTLADCFNATGITDGYCTPKRADWPDVDPYPYTNWYPSPVDATGKFAFIYAPYRFDAQVNNHPAYNIDQPVILPTCAQLQAAATQLGLTLTCPASMPPGGNVSIDMYLQYMDIAREITISTGPAPNDCPDLTGSNDGFIIEETMVQTLDSAAMAKIYGITDPSQITTTLIKVGCGTATKQDNTKSGTLEKAYAKWLLNEGNEPGPYPIFASFEYAYTVFFLDMTATYNAGTGLYTVVLHTGTWGEEVLLARKFYWGATKYIDGAENLAVKPTGWWGMELAWVEDLTMNATISTSFSATLKGVMQYHFQHGADTGPDATYKTADDVPTWMWQPILSDYIYGFGAHPYSELDRYVGYGYIHTTPGSKNYGVSGAYDYVPTIWKVHAGQTQAFQFPTGTVVLYDPFLSTGTTDGSGLVAISAAITLGYMTPATGVGTYNATANTISVLGPSSPGTAPTTAGGAPLESRPIYTFVRKT